MSGAPEEMLVVIREMRGGEKRSTAQLYERYQRACEELGKEPRTKVMFARLLRECGLMRATVTTGGRTMNAWRL